jgi:hypothetical protein
MFDRLDRIDTIDGKDDELEGNNIDFARFSSLSAANLQSTCLRTYIYMCSNRVWEDDRSTFLVRWSLSCIRELLSCYLLRCGTDVDSNPHTAETSQARAVFTMLYHHHH